MENYMEANEKFLEYLIQRVKENLGIVTCPNNNTVYLITMNKIEPVDERSYDQLKRMVRPEWFKDHIIHPHFVEMN